MTRPGIQSGNGRRGRGFSLTELIVVLFFTMLAVGLGMAASSSLRGRMGVEGLALQLVDDIRRARARAMTLGEPVAVVFPQGATAQGYAVVAAEGGSTTLMRVLRFEDWQDGLQGKGSALLAFGSWAGLAFDGTSPRLPQGLAAHPTILVLLANWSRAAPGRYVAFSPNGSMTTANLPTAGGDALIVIADAVSGGQAITAVSPQARVVRISAAGLVTAEQSLPGGSGLSRNPVTSTRPTRLAGHLVDLAASTDQSAWTPTRNRAPVIASNGLKVLPEPAQDLLPPLAVKGRTFSVRPDGTLSMVLKATDPDGDRLYCTWGGHLVQRVAAGQAPAPPSNLPPDRDRFAESGSGTYSVTGVQEMTLQEDGRTWVSTVEWSPPADMGPQDWFALGVLVEDLKGGRAVRWIVVGPPSEPGSLTYTLNALVFVAGADGSDPRVFPDAGAKFNNVWMSPDGRRVIVEGEGKDLILANRDGSMPRVLPCAYYGQIPGAIQIASRFGVVVPSEPSCTSAGYWPAFKRTLYPKVVWSADSTTFAYAVDCRTSPPMPSGGRGWTPDLDLAHLAGLWVGAADGSRVFYVGQGAWINNGPGRVWPNFSLSPDGDWVVYQHDHPDGNTIGSYGDRIMVAPTNVSGSARAFWDGPAEVYPGTTRYATNNETGDWETFPTWSPDGRFILVRKRLGLWKVPVVMNNGWPAKGGEAVLVVADGPRSNPLASTGCTAMPPYHWSPDSQRVTFTELTEGTLRLSSTAGVSGHHPQIGQVKRPLGYHHLAWSPRGGKILTAFCPDGATVWKDFTGWPSQLVPTSREAAPGKSLLPPGYSGTANCPSWTR